MFTGIIEDQGLLLETSTGDAGMVRLYIRTSYPQLHAGESIAVNGVCLTVLSDAEYTFSCDLSPETCALTTLAHLRAFMPLHLERAMSASARFGGHYVSGHVDCSISVHSMRRLGDCQELLLGPFKSTELMYLLPKGSLAVDGVSLTINRVEKGIVHLMLIPHTLAHTHLGSLKVGQLVNIEFDYLTRIVAHQLGMWAVLSPEHSGFPLTLGKKSSPDFPIDEVQ